VVEVASERSAIARLWRADERECVLALIAAAQIDDAQRQRIAQRAQQLIAGMRQRGASGAVEAFTRAFPLNSSAGVALLSLAECLLRIPDAGNIDRLLRDRLSGIDWDEQSGPRGGWLSSSLHLATRLVRESSVTARIATPLVRGVAQLAIKALGAQFVFAQDIESALQRSHRTSLNRFRYSFDMLGEAALTEQDAQRYLQAYERALHAVGGADRGRGPVAGGSVSVKLSAIHPRYSYTQHGRAMQELLPRLLSLARLARQYNIALAIDAEESERLELSIDLIEAVMAQPDLRDWSGFGVVVQAYQKRAPAVIDYLLTLSARRPARLMLRLVKGAYWDAEIKLAQTEGLRGFPVYTRKTYTDVAYLACAMKLLAARDRVMPQFATHNAQTVAAIVEMAAGAGPDDYEFQCLYGMGAGLYNELMRTPRLARPVRVYAPVGTRPTLLAYLMRRLLENGAAASFVQRAASDHLSDAALSADPVQQAAALGGEPHPQIAAPRDIFRPDRINSQGIDLADAAEHAQLLRVIDRSRAQRIDVTPLIASLAGETTRRERPRRDIRNPADRGELIGTVADATAIDLEAAVLAASDAAHRWADTGIRARATVLERGAQLFEQHLTELVALAVRESGKSLANAVGEVREAVDFLRYYPARMLREFNQATHLPLGVVVCISPWNFPLAIFTGQIAAALATGNTVLAKPAEQSSAMAFRAVQLLHEAGVPRAALQLLPGEGETVGARLIGDPRVHGVVFTGSTAAARSIVRQLAERGDVPLIAETGGQNAMIVDSTALAEQVVADVLRSAFDSAGQRCSALRLLCLQREIADQVLKMLEGAMRELRVGDPSDIATDVGPLIDEEARARIEVHLQKMTARVRCRSPLSSECKDGVFLPPTLIEIQSVDELKAEVFGPVLHVLRFDRHELRALIEDINATGYGLTLGIASRIEGTIREVVEHSRAGNLYVNRNMIGAVVGLQPFGGNGLSGTGPKAGGPWYLHRLLRRCAGSSWPSAPRAPIPVPLQALLEWLDPGRDTLLGLEQGRELRKRAQRYAHETLLAARMSLTGYVGESNELRFCPRGVLRASGQSVAALLEQLAAALATGNRLAVDNPELAQVLVNALPSQAAAALTTATPRYEAVLVDEAEAHSQPQRLLQLCREMAAKEGPIVPVIVASDGYALERLLLERTVTINTAAVGGDVRLLALDESPQASV
jgi:RHH-type proline utilization regulon transcriptional repressor/proline dehydrogenase/delta 1-pyrroline-5-carboxylate dehydrogenase